VVTFSRKISTQGELVANSSITHDFEATVFDWHPTERLLAIGWGDGKSAKRLSTYRIYIVTSHCASFSGMVSCWSVDGKTKPSSTFSNNVQHTSTITVLKWNPSGKRLVTGDKVQ
jgi:WD40 repeat protein